MVFKSETRRRLLQMFISSKDRPVKLQQQGSERKTHKKTILLLNNGRKKRQEDYPTSVTCTADVG